MMHDAEIIVRFLSYSQFNWAEYAEIVNEIFGISPTRCLDSKGIAIESPSSFIVSLQNLSDSDQRNDTNILKTVQASFLIVTNMETVFKAQQASTLHYYSMRAKSRDNTFLTIVSGTMHDWVQSIYMACSDKQPKNVRLLFNKCFIIMFNTDLKMLWKNCTRRNHKDGTIIIEAKDD